MTSSCAWLRRLLAVLLIFLISPLAAYPAAQEAGQIAALLPAGMLNNNPAKVKQVVAWNDDLKTDKTGRMRVGLKDGSILSLGSDSELKVVQHDAASQQTELQLNYGRLRSRVVSLTKTGSKFEVRTPTAVAGVIGTDFFLNQMPNGALQLIVYSGHVKLTGLGALAGQTVTVPAGQMVETNSNSIGTPQPTPNGVQQDSIASTSVEGTAAAAAETGGSHMVRNILIMLGVAAVGTAVGITTTSSRDHTQTPTPTPPPNRPPTVGGR